MTRSRSLFAGLSFLVVPSVICPVIGACGGGGNLTATAPPGAAQLVPSASSSAGDSVHLPSLMAANAFGYPATRRVDQHDTLFGVDVADPYRWLEDAKNDEVQAWAKSQDDFTRKRLADLPGRDAIAQRLKELYYVEAMGIPHHRGSRYFYSRRAAQAEKSVVFWKEGKTGKEQVLLDPNTWSADGSSSLGNWSVSWDGKKVAYTVKANNSDESTLYVMDVATGKKSDTDVIDGAKYAYASWTPKGDGFYYTWLPVDPNIAQSERPGYAEVRFHKLGDDPKKDRVVHEKTGDPKTFIGAGVDRHGRWLIAEVRYGWAKNDVFVQDLEKAPGKWQPLVVGKDALFEVETYKDRFYVTTNYKAPKYRIVRVDPAHPEEDKWTEIVAERKDATLHGTSIVGGKLSLHWLKDVVSHVEVADLDGKIVREISLPGLGAASALVGQPDEDDAYYSYESFTVPDEIHETSVKTGKDSLFYAQKVNIDASKFVVEQEKFQSKDGTTVPMFIVHAKDLKKDGTAPTLLRGYGGFQVAQMPTFTSSMYPWIERGGVYAIANLRGGSEYGEEWHRKGMLHDKQNVFDDFVAAAEHLVKAGYTNPSKLAINGGSNGGLLVGAAMTQRPDLFRVVLCQVPLLDMVRYHLVGSGKTWIGEYGSPENEDDFKALFAYSPYHHVTPGTQYPSLLMLSADSDDRVDPMHARKFVAAVQSASTGGIALLRIEKHSGHGGSDMVKATVERLADTYAFALSEMSK
jgi:prolyl oligopeptidase